MSKRTKKQQTIETIKAEKLRFRGSLKNITLDNFEHGISSIREEVSIVLDHAIETKKKSAEEVDAKKHNTVAIDRMLKFAKALAVSGYKHFEELNVVLSGDMGNEKSLHKIERLLGDLARYASISSGMPRNYRAPNKREVDSQNDWAVKCLMHYDQSGWPFASYHSRIRKLFHSSKKQLLYAVLFNTRYYNILACNSQTKPELSYVEMSTRPFQTLDSSIWGEFGQVASIITDQLKEKLTRSDADHTNLIFKHGARVKELWKTADPSSLYDEAAFTIIFILESLTEMMPEAKHFTSNLLQSNLLKDRSQIIREAAENVPPTCSPVLEFYWKTSNIENSLIKRIRLLCSNPSGYETIVHT